MKCSEVMAKLEELSPLSFAEGWDNVGLLVGSREREVESVMIALDATDAVIDQAVLAGADMLLTHHPLIFSPQKRITADDFTGKRISKLILNDISYYACHTNFDVMGMGDEAAERLGLEERSVLEITFEDELSQEGIGRAGVLPEDMTLRAACIPVQPVAYGRPEGPQGCCCARIRRRLHPKRGKCRSGCVYLRGYRTS